MFLPFAVFQSAWSSVQERKPAVLTWWVQGRLSCGEQGQCVWPEKVSCASFQVQFVITLSQCLSASTIRSTSISHLVLSSPFYNSFFVNVAVCLLPSCFLFLQSFSLLPQCLCFAQFSLFSLLLLFSKGHQVRWTLSPVFCPTTVALCEFATGIVIVHSIFLNFLAVSISLFFKFYFKYTFRTLLTSVQLPHLFFSCFAVCHAEEKCSNNVG